MIAAAGNAAALVLLLLVLACHDLLFGQPSPSPPHPPSDGTGGSVLLVVIDGLREDRSRDSRLMPNLVRLAEDRGRGIARVEALLPSTIAGIRTLAEGIVVPPGSFFGDFGTSRSPQGGIFAAASQAGIRTFAAGPRLWNDLYGPWLTGALSVESVTARDEQVLAAGLNALRSRRYGLVVVHLNGPDDAAHQEGGRSKAYDLAVARCDAALGKLVEAAGPGTTILVTGDHGVADPGGHAGHEEEVVAVPLVGQAGEMRQRDVYRLVLAPLGIGPLTAESPRPASTTSFVVVILALLLMAVVGGVILNGQESRHAASILNAALWLALAASLAGPPWLPMLLAFAALGVVARRAAIGLSSMALAAGAVGGMLRLLDGSAPVFPGWALPLALAVGVVAGVLSGRLLGARAVLAGVMAAILPALVARLAGETVSLSTLDVRAAFRIVDGPLGLTGAVVVAALRQGAPALAVVLGLVPALSRAGTRDVAAFSTGLSAALAGQAAVAALVLLSGGDLALASRSVSLLARLVGELSALFLGCALGVAVLRRRHETTPSPARGVDIKPGVSTPG